MGLKGLRTSPCKRAGPSCRDSVAQGTLGTALQLEMGADSFQVINPTA